MFSKAFLFYCSLIEAASHPAVKKRSYASGTKFMPGSPYFLFLHLSSHRERPGIQWMCCNIPSFSVSQPFRSFFILTSPFSWWILRTADRTVQSHPSKNKGHLWNVACIRVSFGIQLFPLLILHEKKSCKWKICLPFLTRVLGVLNS